MSDPTVSHTVLPATVTAPSATIHPDKRVPFGWSVFALNDQHPATLAFPRPLHHAARLRLGVAMDIRTPATLGVCLGDATEPLVTADLSFASPMQVLDIPLDKEQSVAASKQGLTLRRVDPNKPQASIAERRLFFFDEEETYATFAPRLIVPAKVDPVPAFMARLASLASVAPFGWQEAAVLDALIDLRQLHVVQSHLHLFLDEQVLMHEDAYSRARDGKMPSLDAMAMFACLARVQPKHPLLIAALEHFKQHRQHDGSIREQASLAEHNHSIGYTLAAIGRVRQDQQTMLQACQQLRLRRDRHRTGGQLHGRSMDDGLVTFQNDGRSAGLYLLGLVRSLMALGPQFPGTEDLVREAQWVAHWAIKRRLPNGLWPQQLPATVEDGSSTPLPTATHNHTADTLTSAAFGAALAWMQVHKIGEVEQLPAIAKQTLALLLQRLTPDGMLDGACPMYKTQGGEAFLNTQQRVISQAAMGFTGQLLAAVKAITKQEKAQAEAQAN